MAEFTPITTQEEFDKAIEARLESERATIKKDYEGQITNLTGDLEEARQKNTDFETQLAERDNKIKSYETSATKSRIARETGLPYEIAERLSGESEEDIRKDAEALKKVIGSGKPAPQRKNNEPPAVDEKKAAMQKIIRELNGKGE